VIVAVGNQKGGVGKTTLAVDLACAWRRRHRVLPVDADPQRSATAWLGDAGPVEIAAPRDAALAAFLEAQLPQYDAVVVDTPPGLDRPLREAIRAAGLLLVPLQPTPVDVRAVRATLELAQILRGTHLDVRLVLSRLQPGTILGRTAREALAPYGVPILHTAITQRVAVAEAAGAGRAVFDYAPDSLAADEFTAVARELALEVFRHGTQREDEARDEGRSASDARSHGR
jgi:chromosome partitioning protein